MKGPIKRTFERAGQIPPPWSDPQDQCPWAWCRRCLGEIYAPTADGAGREPGQVRGPGEEEPGERPAGRTAQKPSGFLGKRQKRILSLRLSLTLYLLLSEERRREAVWADLWKTRWKTGREEVGTVRDPMGFRGVRPVDPDCYAQPGRRPWREAERPARAERGGEPQWKIDYCLERCPLPREKCRGRGLCPAREERET